MIITVKMMTTEARRMKRKSLKSKVIMMGKTKTMSVRQQFQPIDKKKLELVAMIKYIIMKMICKRRMILKLKVLKF